MKNSNAFLWALSLLCSFAVSCKQGDRPEYVLPKFEKEIAKEFEPVGAELDYSHVSFIHSYGDYLVLVSYDNRISMFLHFMDKRTGEIVCSAVREGRGPGELTFPPRVSVVGNECYLYDRQMNVTHVYDLDRILQGENGFCGTILEQQPGVFSPVGVYHGPDKTLIFSNESYLRRDSTMRRIVLEQDTGCYSYNEYPIPVQDLTWFMYDSPYLTFSPDFSKMAVVPVYGGILERFDLSDGVSLLGTDRSVEPDLDLKMICFSGLASSNDRIFALTDEKGGYRLGLDDPKGLHLSALAVFDWAGHPLMQIRNSYKLECITYDEQENAVYVSLCDPEGVLRIGRMDLGDLPL